MLRTLYRTVYHRHYKMDQKQKVALDIRNKLSAFLIAKGFTTSEIKDMLKAYTEFIKPFSEIGSTDEPKGKYLPLCNAKQDKYPEADPTKLLYHAITNAGNELRNHVTGIEKLAVEEAFDTPDNGQVVLDFEIDAQEKFGVSKGSENIPIDENPMAVFNGVLGAYHQLYFTLVIHNKEYAVGYTLLATPFANTANPDKVDIKYKVVERAVSNNLNKKYSDSQSEFVVDKYVSIQEINTAILREKTMLKNIANTPFSKNFLNRILGR